jgi:serine/threonine protein kinase
MVPLSTSDFVVGRKLGEGAFATVFHGRLKQLENQSIEGRGSENPSPTLLRRSVAIKVIEKVAIERRDGVREAVLQEQRLLRRLTETPGASGDFDRRRRNASLVVPLLASFRDSQFLYIVMDCARGTLADVIREHDVSSKEHRDAPSPLSSLQDPPPMSSWLSWLRTATCLAYQTLQAIEFIHENGVIHCDMKPENLLFSVHGRVQLCDFGSAVDLTVPTKQRAPESWRTAMPRGTSEYASPELLRGREDVTVETDLWSFGCVLFALLERGKSPFHASSDSLAVEKIATFDVATSEIISSSRLPPAWKELVSVLLQRDPRHRWVDTEFAVSQLPYLSDVETLSARYESMKQHQIWDGEECLERVLPDLLSKTTAWMDEPFETMRDGSVGWSAFAL